MKYVSRVYPLLLLAALGCASATASKSSDQPREERNRITAAQLEKITANNAYDAVRLLHPEWMDNRGVNTINAEPTTAAVYVDGSRVGDLEYLRNVQLNSIAEIKYLNAAEASNRYGMGLARGVIEVITKR